MKRRSYFLPVLTFIAGSIVTVTLIGFVSLANQQPQGSAPSKPVIISAAQAHEFYSRYKATVAPSRGAEATGTKEAPESLTVDKEQFEAMNIIMKSNPSVSGFRIYFGVDNASRVGIVVGVANGGSDAVANGIYRTSSGILDLCPPICDVSSPIVK